jgi:hypothetical protein
MTGGGPKYALTHLPTREVGRLGVTHFVLSSEEGVQLQVQAEPTPRLQPSEARALAALLIAAADEVEKVRRLAR